MIHGFYRQLPQQHVVMIPAILSSSVLQLAFTGSISKAFHFGASMCYKRDMQCLHFYSRFVKNANLVRQN